MVWISALNMRLMPAAQRFMIDRFFSSCTQIPRIAHPTWGTICALDVVQTNRSIPMKATKLSGYAKALLRKCGLEKRGNHSWVRSKTSTMPLVCGARMEKSSSKVKTLPTPTTSSRRFYHPISKSIRSKSLLAIPIVGVLQGEVCRWRC